jgi:F-type H+-transporting ATPase subunit delta
VKPLALARRYARALADAAGGADEARLEKTAAELQLLTEVFERAPRALRFLDDPSIPVQDKEKAIASLARAAKLGDLSRRFLQVLLDHRRLGAIPEITRAFTEIKDGRLGIVPAEATTAVPLSAAELKRLKASLEKMTGRTVRLTTRVDPALLGGARTRIGSRVYDGTLRRRLALLRAQLAIAR